MDFFYQSCNTLLFVVAGVIDIILADNRSSLVYRGCVIIAFCAGCPAFSANDGYHVVFIM